MGKNLKKNEYMYVYNRITLLYTWNYKTLQIKYMPIKLNKQINAFQKNHYLSKSMH